MRAIANSNRDLTQRQRKSLRVWIIPFLLSLFAFENIGCSSAKPPTGILSQAELDVRAASEARADELAPMDLQSAREKLEASKQAMAAKKYDGTYWWVESSCNSSRTFLASSLLPDNAYARARYDPII